MNFEELDNAMLEFIKNPTQETSSKLADIANELDLSSESLDNKVQVYARLALSMRKPVTKRFLVSTAKLIEISRRNKDFTRNFDREISFQIIKAANELANHYELGEDYLLTIPEKL